MEEKYSLLLVDDDQAITELLKLYLVNQGFTIYIAQNGLEALDMLDKESIDLILLDIGMPYLDGYETCKMIREKTYVPIIFMSSRREVDDKIKSLSLGGDDYIVKPFDFTELEARVRSQLRRYQSTNKMLEQNVIYIHELKVDIENEACYVKGMQIPLSSTELAILIKLVSDPNRVWSTEELFDAIWGFETAGNVQTIKVHISNLRKKLQSATRNEHLIETVRGFGYKINQ